MEAATPASRSLAAFSSTTSLAARSSPSTRPSSSVRATRVVRRSTWKRPSTTASSAAGMSWASTSVRKPSRPRFTPSTGTCSRRASRTARSRVPSPPRTTTRSSPSAKSSGLAHGTPPPRQPRSSSRVRSSTPWSADQRTSSLPSTSADGRPVWTTTPTRRSPGLTGAPTRSPRRSSRRPGERGALGDGGGQRLLVELAGARPKVQEELDVAGRAGPGGRADPRHPEPLAGGSGGHRAHGRGPDRRVAHHPATADGVPARLELWLDQEHEVGAPAGQGDHGGHDHPERDERQVGDDEIHRPAGGVKVEGAHVRPVQHAHPWVVAEAQVELSVADVDGEDLGRPPAQQHV